MAWLCELVALMAARMPLEVEIAPRALSVGSLPNKSMQPTAGQRVCYRELVAGSVACAAADWRR
jgi:hypothetical protein